LSRSQYQHVLDTFPLVSDAERSEAMRCFVSGVEA
jgi:hypothetical protein